jgi:hypothetical protein
MEYESLSIKRKALKINLEASIYGTFAEIGAGQEVVRTSTPTAFFLPLPIPALRSTISKITTLTAGWG